MILFVVEMLLYLAQMYALGVFLGCAVMLFWYEAVHYAVHATALWLGVPAHA